MNGVRNAPDVLSTIHENIIVGDIALKSILLIEMHEEVLNLHEVNPHVVVQGLNTGDCMSSIECTRGVPKIAVPPDTMMGAEGNLQ